MDSRVGKRWFSVLLNLPPDGWIGRCLLICHDDRYASTTSGEYSMQNGKFVAMGDSPVLESGVVMTHWLHDPRLKSPLPQGWPDCSIDDVKDYLKPYIAIQGELCGQ